jgi:precorrin-6A/cobalt-precorrin-6A reductase
MPHKRVLILGGTGEAAALARDLVVRFGERLDVIISYSGITGHQPDLPCKIRVGGFGGAAGLIRFIDEEDIDFLVDATHPYAETISQHIYVAAQTTEIPTLVLMRLPWVQNPNDNWVVVPDMETAAQTVSELDRPTFLTIGVKELSTFENLGDVPLYVRLLKEPENGLSLDAYNIVTGRPPFSVEDEKKLLLDNNIRVMVSKNSGGDQTYAKIEAARELGIGVVMIDRPPSEPLDHVASNQEVIEWLNALGV